MASILGNYLRARESAYFKLEQEAAVQQHKNRLVKEGKIDETEKSTDENTDSFHDSEHTYEVLAEVLQAQARVDDPNAARKREYEHIRMKGEPLPLSPEERLKYRSTALAAAATIGHVPRLSLSGRNRYGIADITSSKHTSVYRTPTAHEMEVASRGYIASMRALTYGSMLGVALLAVGGTAVFQILNTGGSIPETETNNGSSTNSSVFKDRVQSVLKPLGSTVKEWMMPIKETVAVWIANEQHHSSSSSSSSSSSDSGGGDRDSGLIATEGVSSTRIVDNSNNNSSMIQFQSRLKNRFASLTNSR